MEIDSKSALDEDWFTNISSIDDELLFEYSVKNDHDEESIYITFSYPSGRGIEQEELSLLKEELERYNSLNRVNIKIENK